MPAANIMAIQPPVENPLRRRMSRRPKTKRQSEHGHEEDHGAMIGPAEFADEPLESRIRLHRSRRAP